jgi:methylated-DNA-[protein]-cysteine S-methyltransferase
MSTKYRVVGTRQGQMGIVAGPRGLRRVFLPCRSRAEARRAIRREFPDAVEHVRLLPSLVRGLRHYFDGQPVTFNPPLDCDGVSRFQAAVWQACRKVGYGKTISYGELASRTGRPGAARAVGTAMSRNRFPIVVPCHRVVKSDGSLGGYSGPGGVTFKRRLLDMEAAPRQVKPAPLSPGRGGQTAVGPRARCRRSRPGR